MCPDDGLYLPRHVQVFGIRHAMRNDRGLKGNDRVTGIKCGPNLRRKRNLNLHF